MSVFLLGTLDTKGVETAFVRDALRSLGIGVRIIDTGCLGDAQVPADIHRNEVFAAAGVSLADVRQRGDRGEAVAKAALGATRIITRLHQEGQVDGVLGLGGSAGTTIATAAMRALPIGIPKLMVSTLASGQVRPYVGDKDLLMLNSVVDILGINRISRKILSQAARAMAGMVLVKLPDSPTLDRPLIAATMFGVTTPCVTKAREILEAAGYEVLVFHATGNGGRSMESLIRDGVISGVLDITTTELADELVGGTLSAGPERLTAAGDMGIPQVISVGALDMVNFGPRDTVPKQFQRRTFYQHNETVTLMRTTPDENRLLGDWIARCALAAKGPTRILIPRKGVSAIDAAGQPFDDSAARSELIAGLMENGAGPLIDQYDLHINDEEFAQHAARKLLALIGEK